MILDLYALNFDSDPYSRSTSRLEVQQQVEHSKRGGPETPAGSTGIGVKYFNFNINWWGTQITAPTSKRPGTYVLTLHTLFFRQ
jgi:hypothetical protein